MADPQKASLDRILERLEAVEKQNEELMQEVKALRADLAQTQAPAAAQRANQPAEERLDVAESRIEEQAQTKVEASQRMPLKISGIALFNTFLNSKAPDGHGGYAGLLSGPDRDGATLAQSQLGVVYSGPELPGGGHVSGNLDMDFLNGTGYSGYGLSIRRGVVSFDWEARSVSVGQDKTILSPRQPDSLAEVAIPPLAGEGNLWLWQPQIRYTEHFRTGAAGGIDAQGSVIETNESAALANGYPPEALDPARPALEGRVNIWQAFGENARFDIAGGFHVSTSHVNGYSVPSRMATIDWSLAASRRLRFTGLVFGGRNMAGLGGFPEGFSVLPGETPVAVHGIGGWSQLAFTVTPRWTLNAFCGFTAPRVADLGYGETAHTASCAANAIYRIAPNVLVAAEILQERLGYVNESYSIRNRYDLAIGYLF